MTCVHVPASLSTVYVFIHSFIDACIYVCTHRFNSTETTYSFCFFGEITANKSIALGSFQRWGVRAFDDEHIYSDDDDGSSSSLAKKSDGVDDKEEEERQCAASDQNRTCNADSHSKRTSSLMSSNRSTAAAAASATTSSNASSLSTWIGSISYNMMHRMASSSIGLFYRLTNWYKTTQAGLLNSLDSIILHRKYELTTMQGRPSLIVWLATTLKSIVKAASLPSSPPHLNMTALLHGSSSSHHSIDDDEHYYHYQLYADGAVCSKEEGNPSYLRRATIVHFVCGTYNTIINVTEAQVKTEMIIHCSIVHGCVLLLYISSLGLQMIVLLTESTYSVFMHASTPSLTYSIR